MFKKLFDFGYKRTPAEAVGFFLFYMGLCIIVGFALYMLAYVALNGFDSDHPVTAMDTQDYTKRAGFVAGALFNTFIAFMVVKAKGFLNTPHILWIAMVLVVAVFFGPVFGLILVAFLTTRPTKAIIES